MSVANLPAQNDIPARTGTTAIQPIEPQSYNEVIQFADLAVKAGYFQLKNVQDAALRILYGREMGLSTMQSLMGVQIVEGNPGLKAHVIGARVQKSGVWNYNVVKWDNTVCEIEFLKNGKYYNRSVFTIEDGLRSKGVPEGGWFKPLSNWDKFTRAMLFARALTQGVRAFCPEIFMGPVYATEELADGVEEIDFAITPKQSAAAAADAPKKEPEKEVISENEKCRRIDDWAARAAKRMESLGHKDYASAGPLIVAMHEALTDEEHIIGSADTYRSRVKEIAGHAEWSVVQERLGAYLKWLQESLAPEDKPTEAQPEEKPAAKAPRKRQTTPKPRPVETMTVVSETVGHVIEEAPFEDQPAEDTRIRPRVQPASRPESPKTHEQPASPLAATVASIESWFATVTAQNDEGGMPDLADREVLMDWIWAKFVAAGQLSGDVKHWYSRLNALAKLGGDTNGTLRLLDSALESVRKDYMGEPEPETKPEPAKAEATKAAATGDKVAKLDKLFDEWAVAFDEANVSSYAMPQNVVDQVYFRAMKTGLVSANARDYRAKTKDLATIAETFDGVHAAIHPILEAMWGDFVKPEPGSEG